MRLQGLQGFEHNLTFKSHSGLYMENKPQEEKRGSKVIREKTISKTKASDNGVLE